MEKQGWKILAIVFICLFVIETILFIGLFSIGIKEINNETKCSIECSNDINAGFYSYDAYNNICSCINGDQEVVKEIYIE